MGLLDELEGRGLIHQQTDADGLRERLEEEPITLYVGVDPTADSMHVGHLVAILTMRRFQQAGHKPVILIGGATGMIGDPSGRSTERNLLTDDIVDANIRGIRAQVERFITFEGDGGATLVNNADWTVNVSYIDWLREVGKHFTINYMIAKESVRRRLEDRAQGISYTEFSYMLLQANDFYELHASRGCELQIGGSDQWGNITAGIELTRRKSSAHVYGLTFPLVTTAAGEKFGKSAGNAIWLDPARTSPYAFYQYFVRAEDADVGKYLRYFSFKPLAELEAILAEHAEAPYKHLAQKALATELTELVHGAEGLARALKATDVLFGSTIEGLDDSELNAIFADVPATELERSRLAEGYPLIELLHDTGLCKSRGEARKTLAAGGAYINNIKTTGAEQLITEADLASETIVVLRKGKKNYALARFA